MKAVTFVLTLGLLLPFCVFGQGKKDKEQIAELEKTVASLKEQIEVKNNTEKNLNEVINGLRKDLAEAKKQPTNTTVGSNTQLDAKNKEIEILKAKIAELEAKTPNNTTNKAELDKYKAEAKQATDALAAKNTELNKLKEQLQDLEVEAKQKDATLSKLEIQKQNKDKEIASLREQVGSTQKITAENEALKQQVFSEMDKDVNTVIAQSDFLAAKPKLVDLAKQVNALKTANPNYAKSLDGYLKKLDWYQDWGNAIENATKILAEAYEVKNVTAAILELENVKNSTIVKATTAQTKLVDTQIALLTDYCGRYNYVSNKMNDANDFGADKIGALEEIDAALKRTDRAYTFLIKKLEERKKNPTNKTIILPRVDCPKE